MPANRAGRGRGRPGILSRDDRPRVADPAAGRATRPIRAGSRDARRADARRRRSRSRSVRTCRRRAGRLAERRAQSATTAAPRSTRRHRCPTDKQRRLCLAAEHVELLRPSGPPRPREPRRSRPGVDPAVVAAADAARRPAAANGAGPPRAAAARRPGARLAAATGPLGAGRARRADGRRVRRRPLARLSRRRATPSPSPSPIATASPSPSPTPADRRPRRGADADPARRRQVGAAPSAGASRPARVGVRSGRPTRVKTGDTLVGIAADVRDDRRGDPDAQRPDELDAQDRPGAEDPVTARSRTRSLERRCPIRYARARTRGRDAIAGSRGRTTSRSRPASPR